MRCFPPPGPQVPRGSLCINSIEGNGVTFFSVKESNQRNAGGLRYCPLTGTPPVIRPCRTPPPALPRASAHQTSQTLFAATSFWSLLSGKELPLRSLIWLVPGGGYSVYAAIAFRPYPGAGWKLVPQRCRKIVPAPMTIPGTFPHRRCELRPLFTIKKYAPFLRRVPKLSIFHFPFSIVNCQSSWCFLL